jgi:hypothetical protein
MPMKTNRGIDNVVEAFEKEATEDVIGLWEAVGAAEDIVGEEKEEDVQRLTFDIVRRMLARGFRAGDMSEGGSTVDPWPDQRPQTVIGRIEAEWKALGRMPNIGDIVYFDRDEQIEQ